MLRCYTNPALYSPAIIGLTDRSSKYVSYSIP